jgi:post-segregation antitoxin (ccd killing protein)
MGTPLKYTKVKTIKLTETQHKTLSKMKEYKIDVSRFIRDAIKEKIKREYQELITKPKKEHCPF